jgi:hypothetical protein
MVKARVLFLLLAAAASVAASPSKVVAVNEDNDHYFHLRGPEDMTVAALEAYIDNYACGKVTHFLMCPSGQRTSYDSKVWEPIWKALEEPGGADMKWAKNAKLLHDRGIDPYKVWIRRCREKGISPWLTPRMNDAHFANSEWPLRNTTFWRTRKDLRLKEGPFDFSHAIVRDYTFALVEEQLERYDIDGIELDFMRFDRYFPAGRGKENSHYLDMFVERVKNRLDDRSREVGRKIRLGVRVPPTLAAAEYLGFDVCRWVREGWVDWVCASTYWYAPDYNFRVDEWRKGFGAAAGKVTLLAGTDYGITPFPRSTRTDFTAELYAGFADVEWGNGADGVYLFNAIYLTNVVFEVARRGLFPEDLPRYRRRYPVSFRADHYDIKGLERDIQLPKETNRENCFRVRLGKNPVGSPSVVIGLKEEGDFVVPVTLNGVKALSCRKTQIEITNYDNPARNRKMNAMRYLFPSGCVRPGAENLVVVGISEKKFSIHWCEIVLESKALAVE